MRVEAHLKELVKEVFDRRLIVRIVSETGSHSVSLELTPSDLNSKRCSNR